MVFSWRELPPTPGQVLAITRMCMALRIRVPLEELPRNRMEARNLMYDLRGKLRAKKVSSSSPSGIKVETDAPLFYKYLTERERKFRQRDHPLELSDVIALGSHYGSFPIGEAELDALVLSTPLKPSKWGPHHKVWVGKWELGMDWDRKLVARRRL